MKLARLFAFSTALLALVVVAMFGRIMLSDWQKYRDSEAGLLSMELARKAMVAAEKVSFERGPTNGVLGDGVPADPAKAQRLALARQRTDAALADLRAAIARSHNPLDAQAMPALDRTLGALPAARRGADQVGALPRTQRTSEQTTRAVQAMIAVVPVVMDAVSVLSRNAATVYPQFTDALTMARLSVELREYAGQLGSQFTASLTTGQPLTPGELERIQVLRGRIEQLRVLVERPTRDPGTDPRVVAAMATMEDRYFGADLGFVADVERAGREGAPYRLDTAQFAARYVPDMLPILQLRDVLLAVSIEGATQAHAAALSALVLEAAAGIAVLALLATLSAFLRRRVVKPLLATTRALVLLARGDLSAEPPVSTRGDEIGDLLRALVALRTVGVEKRALELSHQTLIDELRVSSSTDYLTGILNRRAFTEAAGARVQSAHASSSPAAVILFDIDRFKAINDRHGHEAGDAVLSRVVAIVRPELREDEILARYGGEEFIAMPLHCDLASARAVAERLRLVMENARVVLPDGEAVQVTASFGVASAPGPEIDLARLIHAADVALYRAKENGRNRVESVEVAPPAPLGAGV